MTEIIIPRAYEAEQSVLGGLMLDNARWDDIVLLLEPEDFFTSVHRLIYRMMAELASTDKPLDLITLTELLERKALLEQAGGFAYLAELSKNTPSAANIVAYAEIVAEKSRLRGLQNLGQTLCMDVSGPKADASSITEHAESVLFALAEKGSTQQHQEMDVISAMDGVVAYLEQVNGGSGITGTPTGFDELDGMTCGLQSGDLVLVAARPSMGKTSLALSFAAGALQSSEKGTVQIFSIEMPTDQLMLRLVAMEGGVELARLRSGQLDDTDWARISEAMKRFIGWKDRLIIDDNSLQTPALLRSRARRYIRKYGRPSLVLIDYLQLIRCPGQENRTQEIAEISRSLKSLAKELGCPVVALSQLNRQVESRADKRPYNGDLRDSGALEQDADLILFIYRDEVYHTDTQDSGIAELIISKQRQGPTGTVRVQFDGRFTKFSDLRDDYHFGYGRSA
ncbi:TPA: replicative DNA helicase [Salmonella enterica]|uniref:SPI-7-type island replicative DNA helicase n=1 Tax=Salmonella enterica TaxID=28901 RepID=UPI0009AF4B60|nr:SPI-7-type island replicative DNA helicase [Salmonella enterica]HBD1844133.1 replicative DNA helicase [Salmonella enterica]